MLTWSRWHSPWLVQSMVWCTTLKVISHCFNFATYVSSLQLWLGCIPCLTMQSSNFKMSLHFCSLRGLLLTSTESSRSIWAVIISPRLVGLCRGLYRDKIERVMRIPITQPLFHDMSGGFDHCSFAFRFFTRDPTNFRSTERWQVISLAGMVLTHLRDLIQKNMHRIRTGRVVLWFLVQGFT